MAARERILVLGGTGFVGRTLCEKLAERNPAGVIVVPTRHAPSANAVRLLPTVEVLPGSIHGDAVLARAVAGCTAVVNLVAILHGSADEFERVHVGLPRRIVQASQAAGVRRLVHVSALGVGPQAPSNYLKSKTAGEAVFAQSGLDVSILRPSVIFGAEDSFLNLFAKLQSVAPVIPLAGSSARFQPVWVDDVARAIVACLDRPDTIGQVYECAGPDVHTLSELVKLAGRWSGHERPQIALPDAIGNLQALAMELMPGQPLMSRDNMASMRVPNVATGQVPGLQALGIVPTSLAAVGPGYLGKDAGRGRLERWRAGAGRE